MGRTKIIEYITSCIEQDDMTPVKQELIRCRDCVFWRNYCRVVDGVESDHVCSKKRELDGLMHRTKADDFCSWAKRKEE